MKRQVLLAAVALVVISTQAHAIEQTIATTMLPTISLVASTAASTGAYSKELMIAAEADAQMYIASEGMAGNSLVLEAAVNSLNSMNEFQGLSDLDKAKVVIILAQEE